MPNLIVGLGAAMPAFAESFPSNGLMLENKTYANATTVENMLTYNGTAYAQPKYVDTLQQIIGGTYLPAGATVAEQCPKNSYCPGVTDATINASESQGISSCPSGYPNSAVGASAITQCYTTCTLKSANIEHATAVSGNDYYGDGTDTCAATACENGYHVYETVKVIEQRPLIDVDYTVAGNDYGFISVDGSKIGKPSTYGLTENGTWAVLFDYGAVYGRASCQATSPSYTAINYIETNGEAIMAGTIPPNKVRSRLTPIVGAAKANYMADVVAGIADGTKGEEDFIKAVQVVFGMSKDALFSTTDTGAYCYCQMTGFLSESPNEYGEYDISRAVAIESAPWVFYTHVGSVGFCAYSCALNCARNLLFDGTDVRVFRGAMFGALDFVAGGTCEANEIRITWTDAAEADVTANNAGVCTYGGDIRTPVRAATKPGKTFVGWKFSK